MSQNTIIVIVVCLTLVALVAISTGHSAIAEQALTDFRNVIGK